MVENNFQVGKQYRQYWTAHPEKEISIMAVEWINQYITYDLTWYQEKYIISPQQNDGIEKKTLHPVS